MRFCDLFDSYIDGKLKSDGEVLRAIAQFKRNIPSRILQMEFDGSHSNKQGVKVGDKVYKLGLDLEASVVFIEYFENCSQGQPTMSLRVDKGAASVTIGGRQVDRSLLIRYSVSNGTVGKTVSIG